MACARRGFRRNERSAVIPKRSHAASAAANDEGPLGVTNVDFTRLTVVRCTPDSDQTTDIARRRLRANSDIDLAHSITLVGGCERALLMRSSCCLSMLNQHPSAPRHESEAGKSRDDPAGQYDFLQ